MPEVVGKVKVIMQKQKNVTTGKHTQTYVIILELMTHWKKV